MQENKDKIKGLSVITALFGNKDRGKDYAELQALAIQSYKAAFYYYKIKELADKPLTAYEYRMYSAKLRAKVRSLALDAAKAIEDNPDGYVSIVRGYLRRTDKLRKNPSMVFI